MPEKKDEIIDHIIQTGKYRPELINRFDDVVLFSPLTETEQAAVARLLLEDLKTRIEAKGYQLKVNDDLIGALVAVGYQPEFGARPMRRAIQEVVEEAIAEKIIAGSLQTGDTITFTHEELKTLVAAQQS